MPNGLWIQRMSFDADRTRPTRSGSAAIHVEKVSFMILATTKVENIDRFLEIFGTKGADKRALHGSKSATVFRDPTEENRVWALFDWDEQGLSLIHI